MLLPFYKNINKYVIFRFWFLNMLKPESASVLVILGWWATLHQLE